MAQKWPVGKQEVNSVNVTSTVSHSNTNSTTNFDFNSEITRYEEIKAMSRAKKRKHAEIGEIPMDALKNDVAIDIQSCPQNNKDIP